MARNKTNAATKSSTTTKATTASTVAEKPVVEAEVVKPIEVNTKTTATKPKPPTAPITSNVKPAKSEPPLPRGQKRLEPIKKSKNEIEILGINEVVLRKHQYDLTGPDVAPEITQLIEFLDRYESEMSTGSIGAFMGASLQSQLFRNYLQVFSIKTPKVQAVCFELILWRFFINSNGCWGPAKISRFGKEGRWDLNDLFMFNTINALFDQIKDPATRVAEMAKINVSGTVQKYPADKIRYTEGLIHWCLTQR